MPYDVKLPDIGEGVAEGEIVRWLVKAGESVREDQPLVEVMTDKASVEIPSPRTGTIAAIHVEEGTVVPVGTVLISIAIAGESEAPTATTPATAAAHAPASASTAPRATALATPAAGARVQATPAVRQLAKQMGVALESLTGSGPGGAITSDDVKRAASTGAASPAGAPSQPAPGAMPASDGRETRVPLRGLRRRIADHMRRSLDTAAHFTFVAEGDFTALAEHRERLKSRAAAAGIKLTYLAYVLKALIEPLKKHPMLNASLDDERGEVVLKRHIDVAVATHTEEGLTVPVVHDPEHLSLFEVAREIQRLSEAARAGKLKLEELKDATFTVTSTGARGGVLATPILHHPQVGILGVHEIKKRPAVVDDRIVARDLGNLSLSLDHRVVDGAIGAEFLYDVIHRLEHPSEWLSEKEIG
jgi:pyruvate dehydrogenase E2 component (dihydrolipoamide acetyltransferase)